MKLAKNKCAPPFTEAEFESVGVGVDRSTELIDLGIARGLIDKAATTCLRGGRRSATGGSGRATRWRGARSSQSTLRQAIFASGGTRTVVRKVEAEA